MALAGGNYDLILCERGIRSFKTYTRNTMDISANPVVKKFSHLPIATGPSHGTGRDKAAAMARAAVDTGQDTLGLIAPPNYSPWPDAARAPTALALHCLLFPLGRRINERAARPGVYA